MHSVERQHGAWFRSRSALRVANGEAERQLGTALVAGAVLLLAAFDGGFFPSAWRWGAVALAAAGAVAALGPGRIAVSRAGASALAALVGFGCWTALSATWSLDAHASLLESQRVLLYIVAFGAFLIARRGLVGGVVLGTLAVAIWSLVERGGRDPFEGTLLVGPIGYANALGALLAMAAVAALCLRGHALLSLVVLLPALALTNSRGAELAAVIGAAVGLALLLGRPRIALVVLAAAFTALAVLLAAPIGGLGDRTSYWSTARASVPRHVAQGSGAGTFAEVYSTARPQGPPARNAHSLYLETLDETGVIGLVLLLVALGIPLVAGVVRGAAAAPAVAGYTVFLLHAGVDWDWTMPVVAVAALALAAAQTVGTLPRCRAG
jgi:O-antigen ligase/polysaccharide polymerase Wzy-like membrane protein